MSTIVMVLIIKQKNFLVILIIIPYFYFGGILNFSSVNFKSKDEELGSWISYDKNWIFK
jgi:hypothetical protein